MAFTQQLRFTRKSIIILISGILIGALAVLAIRFFIYNPPHTHYHANFAVYINGKREEFKDPSYYQEVAACSTSNNITLPQARAHMHDADNSVIHVHDHAVTWGQFFNNLGWNIGDNFIQTQSGTMHQNNGNSILHIYINNQDYTGLTSIANTVIKDKDRLLVSYGNIDNATLQKESKAVSYSAAKYDAGKDPASCSSNEAITAKDRLKHLF